MNSRKTVGTPTTFTEPAPTSRSLTDEEIVATPQFARPDDKNLTSEGRAMAMVADELKTTKEAACLLRVHPQTLEGGRSTNRYPELRFIWIGSRAIRYRLSDLQAFLDNGTESRA